jgi:pyridine nucleotide-disulfide oxidoreductase family protein
VKRILLAGAGHAHAVLLAALAKKPLYGAALTLASPYPRQVYSGMLPGAIAGHYHLAEAQFDVTALAARAYAEHVRGSVVYLDVKRKLANLDTGAEIPYDFVSLNVGSRVNTSVPGSAEHALAVKPLDALAARLRRAAHVAVVGGGAAGVELAMAIRHRGAEVTLFSERDAFGGRLGRRVAAALRRNKVDTRRAMRVDAVEPGPVVVAGAARQAFDLVLWATGAARPAFLSTSGLALDQAGFVRVDPSLRSVSHPEVFAAGDCASLGEAKSGVHAVRQGALLADNLRLLLQEAQLQAYAPRPKALLILSCGSRYAIATRGGWSVEGRWVWWWKNAIDRRWLKRLTVP